VVVRSLATETIARLAPKLGFEVHVEPVWRYVGRLTRADGRHFYFRNTHFDLNGDGAAETARDKSYAAHFLSLLGYPVPEGRTFFSKVWATRHNSDQTIEAAYAYAQELGFPVIVKPNSKSQGSWVAKVHNKRELQRALRALFNQSNERVALVQRFVPGDDYRIVVLGDDVISAYRRLPLTVVGDDRADVAELLARKQKQYDESGRDTVIDSDDYRIAMRLRRTGRSLRSVPAAGERVVLLDNANLSTGGDAVDVTESMHEGYRRLAVDVTRDMGLRYCGVDVLTTGPIEEPPRGYTILEINAAPGVDHYAESGEKQRRVVDAMYERILRALKDL
jgi:D-alanine-D-alanine ligase-like ATP-grasp enzyme